MAGSTHTSGSGSTEREQRQHPVADSAVGMIRAGKIREAVAATIETATPRRNIGPGGGAKTLLDQGMRTPTGRPRQPMRRVFKPLRWSAASA
jgi:hypothetical protein